MADLTLSTGRAVTFDLYKMSVKDWDALVDPNQPKAEERATLAKCCGMTADEIGEMAYPDYYKLYQAFVKRCANPLAETAGG